MIKIDESIGKVLNLLLNIPDGAQLFCPNLEASFPVIRYLAATRTKVTAIGHDKEVIVQAEHRLEQNEIKITENDNPALFNPIDRFHLGFSAFPCSIPKDQLYEDNDNPEISYPKLKDSMFLYRCSQGYENREAESHVLGLESMMSSVHAGGYFASILPKKYTDRNLDYMRWWRENAWHVAMIKLPKSAVSYITHRNVYKEFQDYFFGDFKGIVKKEFEISCPGDWYLHIWFRPFIDGNEDTPNSNLHRLNLDWAAQSWSIFKHELESLSDQAINKCFEIFKLNDWYKHSVKHWTKMIRDSSQNRVYGTYRSEPIGLPNIEDVWFFQPAEENTCKIHVAKDVEEIKEKENAIHVIPTRSKIKLNAYNPSSQSILHDMRVGEGFKANEESGQVFYEIDRRLQNTYNSVRDYIAMVTENYGGVAYISSKDVYTVNKRSNWLDRQLSPNPRMAPIIIGKDEDGKDKLHWENVYDGISIDDTHPEVIQMWRKRAEQMRMDTVLFPFQLEDVIHLAAKQSDLLGNVMGTGKTLETLFAVLLRCATNCLIVCPAKLIGTWQDEIDNTIIPYARRIRRNWQGRIINPSYSIIEYAEDCNADNLRMFNIISYDKLKAVPRDASFYKCPKCGMVVSAPRAANDDIIVCPGNPNDKPEDRCNYSMQNWRSACRIRDEHDKLKFSKHKVYTVTGKKVHWDKNHPSRALIPEEQCAIVDTRPEKPDLVVMDKEKNQHDKMIREKIGMQTSTDSMGNVIKIPKYDWKKRSTHVAWTFSDLLRWRFNHVIVDEILHVSNTYSIRTNALNHLCGTTRIGAGGTPMKGLPQKILAYMNWIMDRDVFPHYRMHLENGLAEFLKKYKTEVKVGGTMTPDGIAIGAKSVQVHKINNPELFQTELAPMMIRRVRNEPDVLRDIPRIPLEKHDFVLPMDDEHYAYYEKWLDKFAEWWEQMKDEEEGKNVRSNIIAKLAYLIGASCNPHTMLNRITESKDDDFKKWALIIGEYKGPPTSKMIKAREIILNAASQGDKVLFGSNRSAVLDSGQTWVRKYNSENDKKLYSMIVDGRTSLSINRKTNRSKRHDKVQEFRTQAFNVMWCGMKALAEGMNIPEANHSIIHDVSWEPSDVDQFVGRELRPQQRKTVHQYHLMHQGTIDDYMVALCYLKKRSHSEGLDFMDFDDFSTKIIPDIHQYANAIVDGTEDVIKREMWNAVEHLKKKSEEEGE